MVTKRDTKKSRGNAGFMSHIQSKTKIKQKITATRMEIQTQRLAQVSAMGPKIHPQGRKRLFDGQIVQRRGIVMNGQIILQRLQGQQKMERQKRSYKSLNKIFYISLLMIILYGILFYLDMINQFSLQNIVSVIFGFLIMILVQLRFISFYFGEKMKDLNLDEVGVIQDFISNKIFGEINLNYIAKKQKIKYYQHTKDEKDRLFTEENIQTFDCVMSVLRSKGEIDISKALNKNDRVTILKEKWDIFQAKITQFQIFLKNFLKVIKERSQLYKKFQQKVSATDQSEFQKWKSLFGDRHPIITQNNELQKKMQQYDCGNWMELKKILDQKCYFTQTIVQQFEQLLLNQFKVYANYIKSQLGKVVVELQTSSDENSTALRAYRQMQEKIKATNEKIEKLMKNANQKTKGSQNMQLIFNTEYNLRFLRVELSNFEVRKTYLKDMVHRNSQSQYKLCCRIQSHLQESGTKKFNNKISHYLLSYFDRIKSPFEKNSKEQKLEQQNYQHYKSFIDTAYSNMTLKQVNDSLSQIQISLRWFKAYIGDLINLSGTEIEKLNKINEIIKDYQKQWKVQCMQFKYAQQVGLGERVVDSMFIGCIESLNNKQIQLISKLIKILKQQYLGIQLKEKKLLNLSISNKTVSQIIERSEGKRQKSKTKDSHSFDSHQLRSLFDFQANNKLRSYLSEILMCFIQGYTCIKKQIEEKKQYIQIKIRQSNSQESRISRMNEYKDEIFKLERQEFLRQQKQGESDSRVSDEKSLRFVNRILDAFAQQWRNSQFFHEILKEQIQISLNTKRPPILNYMNVRYIKVHKKDPNTLQSLQILSDNVFTCSFEALVNFKGQIAVHIETEIKQKKIPINIRLLIKEFQCPIRICFTPFCLGKSNVTMMRTPKLNVQYSAKLGSWQITKIPFISIFIELFIVIKLRKKFLFPKKATVKVPLAVKNAISEAIKQRVNYQKLQQKKKKAD